MGALVGWRGLPATAEMGELAMLQIRTGATAAPAGTLARLVTGARPDSLEGRELPMAPGAPMELQSLAWWAMAGTAVQVLIQPSRVTRVGTGGQAAMAVPEATAEPVVQVVVAELVSMGPWGQLLELMEPTDKQGVRAALAGPVGGEARPQETVVRAALADSEVPVEPGATVPTALTECWVVEPEEPGDSAGTVAPEALEEWAV
jgi:hypothetical protein